ncbi:MAG: sulfurtransferase TusA family protein [Gammaproteobacteria bacterium]|nr:sulfurtransferase TusA family protein [Gammaproteobacteria bacterium]
MGLFSRKRENTKETKSAAHSVTLDGNSYIVGTVVDCIGDSCPRPQLMTKQAMNNVQSGAIIEVQVDNPTSMEAIPPMMGELNGAHLGTIRRDRYWAILLRKG